MSHVRVALVGMPTLLHDIARDVIGTQPWAEIVGDYDEGASLPEVAATHAANVLVVGDTPQVEAEATVLLSSARSMCVLAISDDGRETALYALRPSRELLGEVSPQRLLAAIRGAVSPLEV